MPDFEEMQSFNRRNLERIKKSLSKYDENISNINDSHEIHLLFGIDQAFQKRFKIAKPDDEEISERLQLVLLSGGKKTLAHINDYFDKVEFCGGYISLIETDFFKILKSFIINQEDDTPIFQSLTKHGKLHEEFFYWAWAFWITNYVEEERNRIIENDDYDSYWIELALLLERNKPEQEIARLEEELKRLGSNTSRFPYIAGLRWEEVTITFISDDSVKVSAREVSRKFIFAELGFKDNRKGDMPDTRWALLRELAAHSGEIAWDTPVERKAKSIAKAAIKDIRRKLKAFMGIEDDPFFEYRKLKAYKTKFTLSDGRLV